MCVIVNKEIGGKISKETFDKCWARNGDGGGYVAIHDGKVIMEKGIMNKEDFYNKVSPYFGKESSLILHFRIQSRGGVSTNLTHPFDCSEEGSEVKRYLFHNGTVRCLSALPVGHSDTSFLASWLKLLSDEDCKKMLENLVDKGYGRFVLAIGSEVFYWGDNESVIKKKVWYSNTKHETFDPKKDSRPLIGDGACDYSDYYFGVNNHKNSKPATQSPSTPAYYANSNKVKLLKEILQREAINSYVTDAAFEKWSDQIIEEYNLLDLSINTLEEINKSKSSTPILDYLIPTT